MRCGGTLWSRPCRGRKATRRPATSPITTGSLGIPNGVSTTTSSTASRNSYSPEPPMTPIAARSVLARSATAGQAAFEPREFDPHEGGGEIGGDRPLEAASPPLLFVLPDLSAGGLEGGGGHAPA